MKTAFIRIGRYGVNILLSLLSLMGILYLFLFTPLGNYLVKPLVEKKLSSLFQMPLSIENFSLTHDTLNLNLADPYKNSIRMEGKFSLLTLNLHAFYQADLSHDNGLNAFKIPLKTSGAINGGYGMMAVEGTASVFEGNILYRLQLDRFAPASLHLSANNIHYQNFMKWLEYPHNSSTSLTGELDLQGLNRRDIEGYATLHTHTENFSPSEIIDDNSSFDFLSLFTDDQGKIQPFHLNLTLNASVDELGILEQFATLPLRGDADLNATLQGDQDRLVMDTHSTVADSSTHARLHWKRLRPSYVYLNMDHADAGTLFHLFSLPSPIEGNVHLNAESNITQTTATLTVRNGLTHPDIFKRDYHLTQPQTRFTAAVNLHATPKTIRYRGNFSSDLTRLKIDDTTTHEGMLRDLLKAIP